MNLEEKVISGTKKPAVPNVFDLGFLAAFNSFSAYLHEAIHLVIFEKLLNQSCDMYVRFDWLGSSGGVDCPGYNNLDLENSGLHLLEAAGSLAPSVLVNF